MESAWREMTFEEAQGSGSLSAKAWHSCTVEKKQNTFDAAMMNVTFSVCTFKRNASMRVFHGVKKMLLNFVWISRAKEIINTLFSPFYLHF